MLSDKYRPVKWKEIIGQKEIIISLRKAIQKNKLSRFLFFFGPKGVGKNTCAHLLAKELNSFSDSELKNFSNIFEINGIFHHTSLIDFCKIINQSRFFPKKGKYNILIIRELNMFSSKHFNYLLKFIEEKHTHILFIFCGTEEKKIPEILLSRCQIFYFQSISTKEIFFYLKMIAEQEHISIENESLFLLSKYSGGSIGKAIFIFDRLLNNNRNVISKNMIMKKLGIIDAKFYFQIIDHILNEKMYKIFILLDKISQEKINFYDFIIGFIKHLKNLFLSKNIETISILKFEKKIIEYYIEQSKKTSYLFLINALNIFFSLENKFHSRLTIEIYFIQLVYFFSLDKNHHHQNKLMKIENNKEFFICEKNEQIHFLQKNWINFIQKFSEKINGIYLDFLKSEIKFHIIKNKIFFMIPYKLDSQYFLLIQTHFVKYLKQKLNNPHLEWEIIKTKSKKHPIETFNFLYQKNKLIETLIERLDLKISSST
nr:AAA family ATPase [Blattabacterium cuenoti]